MNINYINAIPKFIAEKRISKEQALQEIILFIQENYAIFNMSSFSDDFKSELILAILDKGNTIFDKYSSSKLDFFNYLYSYVKNTEITLKRKIERQRINDFYNVTENVLNIPDKMKTYSKNYNYDKTSVKQKKYKYNKEKLYLEEIKKACRETYKTNNKYCFNSAFINSKEFKHNKNKLRKTILVLALKSSYYLSDTQINIISDFCNIKKETLYSVIDDIKFSLIEKQKNKKNIEEKRNKAYYLHKQYMSRLSWLISEDSENNKYQALKVKTKYDHHTLAWENLNKQLVTGKNNIRPTNKAIADILGICERQVSYYIKAAKRIELTQS